MTLTGFLTDFSLTEIFQLIEKGKKAAYFLFAPYQYPKQYQSLVIAFGFIRVVL